MRFKPMFWSYANRSAKNIKLIKQDKLKFARLLHRCFKKTQDLRWANNKTEQIENLFK